MDIANFIPAIAKAIGVAPSTLVFLLFVLTTTANALTRAIPSDATGWLGVVRKICAVIGIYVSNRVTSGVTVTDVAKIAIGKPVDEKVAAAVSDVGEAISDLSPTRARETVTAAATRLVDPLVLHRGIAPAFDKMRPGQTEPDPAPGVYTPGQAIDALRPADPPAAAEPATAPLPPQCTLPPPGWYCTRTAGHDGPCAALPVPPASDD